MWFGVQQHKNNTGHQLFCFVFWFLLALFFGCFFFFFFGFLVFWFFGLCAVSLFENSKISRTAAGHLMAAAFCPVWDSLPLLHFPHLHRRLLRLLFWFVGARRETQG